MTETEQFKILVDRNPHPGIPFNSEDYIDNVVSRKGSKYFNIFGWAINSKKKLYKPKSKVVSFLSKYGISFQVYYDVVVLGLTSIEQRPKCIECGNTSRFSGITAGYLKTCSSECYTEMNRKHIKQLGIDSKGREMSESTKQKIRNLKIGLKYSEESSYKKSIKMTEWIINNGGMSSRKYKRGEYISDIFNNTFHYDSSWEKVFIQLLEKSCIKDDIISLERCKESIEYLKDDNSRHKYIPDFDIKLKNGYRVIVEIKPKNFLEKDRIVFLKRQAGYKYFKKQKQTLYIILTENELFKDNFWLYDYLVII